MLVDWDGTWRPDYWFGDTEFLRPWSSFNLPLNHGRRRQVSVSLGFCLQPEFLPHHQHPSSVAPAATPEDTFWAKGGVRKWVRQGKGQRGGRSDGRQISRSSQLDGFQSVRPSQIKSVLEANRGTTRLSSATSGGRVLPSLSNKLQSPKWDQWLLERTFLWCWNHLLSTHVRKRNQQNEIKLQEKKTTTKKQSSNTLFLPF